MKEEMEAIKLRSGNQLARENYLLLNKSKAQILNILLNTEEKMENLQSQLKAKEEENEQLKADYGNLAQVERDFLKEVIKEAREYIKKHIQKCDIDGAIGNFDEFEILASPKTLLEILSKGENK